jgi:uncharacterized membrane protein YbhN (UPF0104 family)
LKKRLLIVARSAVPFVLTALLLWHVSNATDSREVMRQLSALHPNLFGAAVILMLLSAAIATLRYQIVLQTLCPGGSVYFFPLMKLNLLTLFSAHFLPFGALADGMRAIVSRKLLKIPVGMAVEGVITDRSLALAGFAIFGLLLLPLQIALHWRWPLIAAQAAIFGGLLTALAVAGFGFGRYAGFVKPLAEAVRRFAGHFTTRRSLGWQLCLAAASTALFAAILVLLALSLDLHLSFWIALAVTPAIYLSQVVPIFYAGFGSREVAVVALLVPSGVLVNSDAVALGLSVGLCNLAASLPGAIFAWSLVGMLGPKTIAPGSSDCQRPLTDKGTPVQP